MNFCKRSYQPILRSLYTETIKRGGEISLHKHYIYIYIDFTYTFIKVILDVYSRKLLHK